MDSKHWTKDLPAEVREVLDAGASLSAPHGAKQAVWRALATKLPAATVGASAGGLTALAIIKPLAVGLVFGAVATTFVIELRSKTTASPRPSASASGASAVPGLVRPRPTELAPQPQNEPAALDPLEPARSLKPASTPSPAEESAQSNAKAASLGENAPSSGPSSIAAFPDQVPGAPREDRTVEESRRLNQARATLHAGDARAALSDLEAIAVDFPRGVLVQELDALRIEALLELGERQRARELARRFLDLHPHSPHAAAVERALH